MSLQYTCPGCGCPWDGSMRRERLNDADFVSSITAVSLRQKDAVACGECGSLFFKGSSQPTGLRPECARQTPAFPRSPVSA